MITKHYVCTGGCNGVAEMPGVCGAESCAKYNQPLMECKCENGNHEGVMKKCQNCGKLCEGNCDIEVQKPELPA